MSLAYDAMVFAKTAHQGQVRKYTGAPYSDHLAEVAGIVGAVLDPATQDIAGGIAIAWLHDAVEDCGIQVVDLAQKFGFHVAQGVWNLSDMETFGNRACRKAASRDRLSRAPSWVQTIKCADLISNTSSIVKHDPKFAVTYLAEKRLLLDVLTKADRRIWAMARDLAEAA